MRRVSQQEWENEHMHNPMTEGEALAVLRRLKDALPDVGLNGWMEGVHAVDVAISVLTAHTAASGGEVAGWQVNLTRTGRGWEACTRECYEDTLRTGRYAGLPAGTRDVMVREVYAAPPATKASALPNGWVAEEVENDQTLYVLTTPKGLTWIVEPHERLHDLLADMLAASPTPPAAVPADALERLVASMESAWRPNCCCSDTAKSCADELAALIQKGAEHEQR